MSITATSSPSGASGFLVSLRYVTLPESYQVPEGGGGRSATPTAAAREGARLRNSAAAANRSRSSAAFSTTKSSSVFSSESVPSTQLKKRSATTRERAVPAPATDIIADRPVTKALAPPNMDLCSFLWCLSSFLCLSCALSSGSGTRSAAPDDLSISSATSSASFGSALAADFKALCTSTHTFGDGPFAPPTDTARSNNSRVGAFDESK